MTQTASVAVSHHGTYLRIRARAQGMLRSYVQLPALLVMIMVNVSAIAILDIHLFEPGGSPASVLSVFVLTLLAPSAWLLVGRGTFALTVDPEGVTFDPDPRRIMPGTGCVRLGPAAAVVYDPVTSAVGRLRGPVGSTPAIVGPAEADAITEILRGAADESAIAAHAQSLLFVTETSDGFRALIAPRVGSVGADGARLAITLALALPLYVGLPLLLFDVWRDFTVYQAPALGVVLWICMLGVGALLAGWMDGPFSGALGHSSVVVSGHALVFTQPSSQTGPETRVVSADLAGLRDVEVAPAHRDAFWTAALTRGLPADEASALVVIEPHKRTTVLQGIRHADALRVRDLILAARERLAVRGDRGRIRDSLPAEQAFPAGGAAR